MDQDMWQALIIREISMRMKLIYAGSLERGLQRYRLN